MKQWIATAALFALAACGQPAEAPAEQESAALSLQQQVRAEPAEMRPVFAYQQLMAYFQAHPELEATCIGPRGAEARGTVPENVAPDSLYGPYVGADAYAVQCGEQLTTVRDDPRQRWLVVFAPDATEPVVVNCADPQGRDQCAVRQIPTVTAP